MFRNLNEADFIIMEKNKKSKNVFVQLRGKPEYYCNYAEMEIEKAISSYLRHSFNQNEIADINTEAGLIQGCYNELSEIFEKETVENYVARIQKMPKVKQIKEIFGILIASALEDKENSQKIDSLINLLMQESYNFKNIYKIILKVQTEDLKELLNMYQKMGKPLNVKYYVNTQILSDYVLTKCMNSTVFDLNKNPQNKNSIQFMFSKLFENPEDNRALEIFADLCIKYLKEDNASTKEESILYAYLKDEKQIFDFTNQSYVQTLLDYNLKVAEKPYDIENFEKIKEGLAVIDLLVNDFYGDKKYFQNKNEKAYCN